MVGCTSASRYQDSTEPPLRTALALTRGTLRRSTHSYVRMPYGLPNVAAAHQRLMRAILEAQEVRHPAVLAEVAMVPEDLHVPPEPPEAPGPGGS